MRLFPTPPFRSIVRIIEHIRAKAAQRDLERKVRMVRESPYFDAAYYLATYPDVRASGMDPAVHYLLHGALEGRNPSDIFNTNTYLERNPGLKANGTNPLIHIIETGERDRTSAEEEPTWPSTDTQHDFLPDTSEELLTPAHQDSTPNDSIEHEHAGAEPKVADQNVLRLQASSYFDADYYLTVNADVRESGMDPATHFYLHGGLEGRNPSASFNTIAYLHRYPELRDMGINPLIHFIDAGEGTGLSSEEEMPWLHPGSQYADMPDIIKNWMYPVCMEYGQYEGTVRVTSYDASIRLRQYGDAISHWEKPIQDFWKTFIDRYYEFFILPGKMKKGEVLDVGAEFYNKYIKEVIADGQHLTVVDLKEPDHPDIRIVQDLDAYERFDMTVDDHRDFPQLSGRFDTALSFGVLSFYDIPPEKCIRYLENLAGFLKPDGLVVMKFDLSVIARHRLFPSFLELHRMVMDRFTIEAIDILTEGGLAYQIYFGRKK